MIGYSRLDAWPDDEWPEDEKPEGEYNEYDDDRTNEQFIGKT